MKKIFRIFLIVIIVSVTFSETKAQSANVSFSVFYNSLKPHGRWMNNSTYGQVWVSNTKGFIPYSTNGHWAYTDYGWTWVSDYDWGWAPFHYGRWAYHATYGWYWVPGYQWAPAWVAWRNSNDYYGWAPLSPGLNISIGVSTYNSIPSGRWVFAPHRYITSPHIARYYAPRTQNVTIIKRTTIVNNVTVKNNVRYVAGPKKQDVERVNRTQVHTYTVSNSSGPGKTVVNNNTVSVYRPVINNDKTVVNDNDKTVINKNSNNTTVNKSNNSKTVTKNDNDKNTTVNKNETSVTKNSDNKTVNKTNNETVNKNPKDNKKPAGNASLRKQENDDKKQKAKPQQQKDQDDVAKRKKQNNDDDRRKK